MAFSGGADSAFLAWIARDALGDDGAEAVTAVSASLAPEELDDCRALAAEWRLRWSTVDTDELDDPTYVANDGDRCASCKTALMDAVGAVRGEPGATVVLGVNVDDLGDHRPGQAAAAERGARFPLVEAGFTKAMVREASRRLGLRTWDKPAAACLASRIPYGTPVDRSRCSTASAGPRVGCAGSGSSRCGCATTATPPASRCRSIASPTWSPSREAVVDAVAGAGYARVTLDLEGLRSGNLNADLVSSNAR